MFNKILFKFPERVSLKTLVLRTPCFGSSYPQVVRVPPVKNHCSRILKLLDNLHFLSVARVRLAINLLQFIDDRTVVRETSKEDQHRFSNFCLFSYAE